MGGARVFEGLARGGAKVAGGGVEVARRSTQGLDRQPLAWMTRQWGRRWASYPTHHVIGRIVGTRAFPPPVSTHLRPPSLHLSLAGWSAGESGMPSLVTCQRSQTPVRPPPISNLPIVHFNCNVKVEHLHIIDCCTLCAMHLVDLAAAILATCHCLKRESIRPMIAGSRRIIN